MSGHGPFGGPGTAHANRAGGARRGAGSDAAMSGKSVVGFASQRVTGARLFLKRMLTFERCSRQADAGSPNGLVAGEATVVLAGSSPVAVSHLPECRQQKSLRR